MITLRYVGKTPYRGVDGSTGRLVVAWPGDRVAVSESKAQQLLRDFPEAWEVVERRTKQMGRPKRRRMKRPQRDK